MRTTLRGLEARCISTNPMHRGKAAASWAMCVPSTVIRRSQCASMSVSAGRGATSAHRLTMAVIPSRRIVDVSRAAA